jgi:hypothetical protein
LICDLEQLHDSGGDCIGEVHSLIFQDENPRSGLNWLCLAMSLLKALFESEDFLKSENLRSLIRRRWCLCSVPFLEASLLEKLNFYFGGVRAVVLRNRSL